MGLIQYCGNMVYWHKIIYLAHRVPFACPSCPCMGELLSSHVWRSTTSGSGFLEPKHANERAERRRSLSCRTTTNSSGSALSSPLLSSPLSLSLSFIPPAAKSEPWLLGCLLGWLLGKAHFTSLLLAAARCVSAQSLVAGNCGNECRARP